MITALAGFAVVAGLMTLVPGIDTALVLRAGVTQGTRAAYATVAGISLGLIVGAAYLVWLGARLLWHARTAMTDAAAPPKAAAEAAGRAFSRGLVTNLLNPKIGVFYIAVLPQFLPPDTASVLAGFALAMVHVVEGVLWFSVLIPGTAVLRERLARPRVRAWTDRITGCVLVAFGIKVALSRA